MNKHSPSTPLDDSAINWIKDTLGASHVTIDGEIQSLWNNQGQILRIKSDVQEHPVSVLKAITPNRDANHPRGWDTSSRLFDAKTYILLEDLSIDYPLEREVLSVKKALDVLDWLASFHATLFVGRRQLLASSNPS